METERRALYNLLRLNWLRDPSVKVERWQVEDLRSVSTPDLLYRINEERNNPGHGQIPRMRDGLK